MLTHADEIDDGHELAADPAYAGPGWYAVDLNGLLAGPFDDADQTDWWIDKALRVG
jgi:hypothetical protein